MKNKTFSQRYKQLMCGETVVFSENEIIELLWYLDYYHINTLQIQSCPEETTNVTRRFICRTDEPTFKAYLKEQTKEMAPLG